MEFSDRRPFRPFRVLISMMLLAGAASAGWFLYQDIERSGGRRTGKPLAFVERMVPNVRVKTASSFVWMRVGAGDGLYKRDSLQVGADGSAVVRFSNNSKLEVGADSLVVIDDDDAVNLNFLKGSFILRKQSGKDELIRVKKRGAKKEIRRLPVRVISPKLQASYFVEEGQASQVEFKWKGAPSGASIVVEVSEQKTFPKAGTRWLNAKGESHRHAFREGTYYWRLRDSKKVLSERRLFRVAAIEVPSTTFPVNQDVPNYSKDSITEFRWVTKSQSRSLVQGEHHLQVALDAQFKQIVKSTAIDPRTGKLHLEGLGPGQYFWRIQSDFEQLSVKSRPQTFEVKKVKEIPVRLLGPRYGKAFDRPQAIRFSWRAEVPARRDVTFQIEVQGKRDQVVFEKTTQLGTVVWSNPKQGLFRWRVSVNVGTVQAGASKWSKFFIYQGKPVALVEPSARKEVLFWEHPTTFEFSWQADPLVEKHQLKYLFEVAKDTSFETPLVRAKTHKNRISSENVKLKEGDYFWRVSLMNSAGDVLKVSEARQFFFGHFPVLHAPGMASPSEGVDVLIRDEPALLTWASVKNARKYRLRIYLGEKVVLDTQVKNPQYRLPLTWKAGKYYWTVQAIDRIDRPGQELALRELNLSYGETLEAPVFFLDQ